MRSLAGFYLPGALTLWCGLFFALAALWGYAAELRGDATAKRFARRAYAFFALSMLLAGVVMAIALARRDFRIEYVFQYSGLDLPGHYQIAAFWAGQKGSFLIWLIWGALLGLPLLRSAGRFEAPVMGIYTLTQLGILLILVRENPFSMLAEAPVDGKGLNPLLQDDWMVIHPPIMFVGYALAAMPFAFAMAGLWRRDTSEWARRAFPWALAGFLVLGTAILMGGYWAYKTLGWGGYWGWDPVENASLIPWLLGTALIHGLYLERTKGRYRRVNLVLAALVYLSVLYGTFLTRSGVLADFSVHSFVDLGISGWLIGLMLFFVAMAVFLLATRLGAVESSPSEDPVFSRGTFVMLSTISVLTAAVVVTAGTSAPLLTRFMENPGQVGPEFYNRVNFPLALLVAGLLALIPYLTWRGEQTFSSILKRARVGLAFGAAATLGAALWQIHEPLHLVFVFLAATALATNLEKTVQLARSNSLARAGGYLAHVGVGIILLGFLASSAYDESVKVTLAQGEPKQVGDLTLTFTRFVPRTHDGDRESMEVAVERGGKRFLAYPKMFVNERTQQLMVNPYIESKLLADLYFSPLEYDPGSAAGQFAELALAKGEEKTLGDLRVRFLGFNMNRNGNALAQMTQGKPVEIGAQLEVSRAGVTQQLEPVYQFSGSGQVQFPALPLPGGGRIAVGAVNASASSVQLLLDGVGAAGGEPARLSLDVTRKPLIKMVWYGLYVVLAGGLLALAQRVRQLAAPVPSAAD